jgi:hypothetical protein
LDEVEQVHARREREAAGDVHDEPEVGSDEPIAGALGVADVAPELDGRSLTGVESTLGASARFDGLRQLHLLSSGEQGHHPDLVQVLSDSVSHQLSSHLLGLPGRTGITSLLFLRNL